MDTEQKDITLPLEVVDGRFTLEQVGVISVLMGIPSMTKETVEYWGKIPKFMDTINGFVKCGMATAITEEDGSVKLEIELL